MRVTASVNRSCGRFSSSKHRRRVPHAITLWRLRGATDDLRCLAIETSFGCAFAIELDAELVLLHLQANLERVVAYANRIASALVVKGWQVIEEPPVRKKERSCSTSIRV
jgi:hypothetical protein